jgi:hypothetical protein
VAFYDVADCKAWLVDGASALLHLVRISLYLDETDPESCYDWRFDKTKLRENWPGATGRHAAMKTLSCWANLLLPVYVKDQVSPAGAAVEEYSTFQARVEKILHSLEILVDVQTYFASTEGIKIYQNIYLHKTISGFDILDFLQPLGPIGTRVKKIDFWGDGWMDLLPAAGIVTIFGEGFGELIRPENAQDICSTWQSIPSGEEYLISTVSTLELLQNRLERNVSHSETGNFTDKISWRSSPHTRAPCKCADFRGRGKHREQCPVPVHFLVSKSSLRKWNAKALIPVDINALDANGAVVFANLSLTGQRIYATKTKQTKPEAGATATSIYGPIARGHGSSVASTRTSTAGQPASSTEATDSTEPVEISSTADIPAPVEHPPRKSTSKAKKVRNALVLLFKRSPP